MLHVRVMKTLHVRVMKRNLMMMNDANRMDAEGGKERAKTLGERSIPTFEIKPSRMLAGGKRQSHHLYCRVRCGREGFPVTVYCSESTELTRWFWKTGLAPWEFEFHFSGSLIPTLLVGNFRASCQTLQCP